MKWRRKRPVIEFVTDNERIREFFPPVPAARLVPDWFRQAKLTHGEPKTVRRRGDLTIKGCPGVHDYLSLGYIIPMWADHIISAVDGGFSYDVDYPPQHSITSFPPVQWDAVPRREQEHANVLKLALPWELRTPKGWSILLMEPWYHREDRWTVMPGVVDSDILGTLNLVALWHLPVGEQTLIKAGTPLVHVIPFRRDRLDLSVIADKDRFADIVGRGVRATGVSSSRFATGAYREVQRQARESSRG